MERIISSGWVFDVIDCKFSVIHQEYRLTTEAYKCIDYWRRESGEICIQKSTYVVHISKNTPHIVSILDNEGIVETEILGSAEDYIDYAIHPENKDLVRGEVKVDWINVVDRLEHEDIWSYLKIPQTKVGEITLYNAY